MSESQVQTLCSQIIQQAKTKGELTLMNLLTEYEKVISNTIMQKTTKSHRHHKRPSKFTSKYSNYRLEN
jgi:hypothetical protein